MALTTGQVGSISELQAALKAIENNFVVSKPLTVEAFDYVLLHKETGEVLKAQVKTIYHRQDNHYYVLFAKKSRKKRYAENEVDVFLGVYQGEVYFIPNSNQSEYWTKNLSKWKML